MDVIDSLKIDLRTLPLGERHYEAVLDELFFSVLRQDEIQRGKVQADITVRRTSQETFEVECRLRGEVEVPCTVCWESMSQPIEGEETLKVRFGESDGDDGEVITVGGRSGMLDLSWPLYELAALSIPIRHVHEGCDREQILLK